MTSSDILLIERLRKENVDQFFTLVRMHLSFVVDINTDDVDYSTDKPKQFRWNFHKKVKGSSSNSSQNNGNNVKNGAEVNSITEDGILRLNELIDFLAQPDNVKQEGIFRRTGSLNRQQELRQLLITGSNLCLDEGKFSVHDCASVLKGFLAELPQPLLMDQYYQTYCTLANQYPPTAESSQTKLLTALQLLLLLLAPPHRSFLERLLKLLRLVADNEASNRMSPDTLATMFTPHLLCPRKLSPETFHSDSIALSPLISFMIRECSRVFEPPSPLVTDATAYFTVKEHKKIMSPDVDLDESITDRTAAKTVFTFVDRTLCGGGEGTAAALARLYAHVHALPDSQHKRRLVKHFNRQNGIGTPIQIQRNGKVAGSRSFGDSIKRHIFNKGLLNKTPKKGSGSNINFMSEKSAKTKLRFADESKDVSHKNIVLKNLANKMATESPDEDSDASNESTVSEGAFNPSIKLSPKFVSEPNLSSLDAEETPKNTKRGNARLFRSKGATSTNKKYRKRSAARATPTCVSCFDDQNSENERSDLSFSTPGSSDRQHVHYLTSTPGVSVNGVSVGVSVSVESPSCAEFRRASMSPITMSTQKLSKAMQESIMTPRSRKPLIVTSEQRDSLPPAAVSTDDTDKSDVYTSMSHNNDSDFVSSDDEDMSKFSYSCEQSNQSGGSLQSKRFDGRSISISDVSPLRSQPTRFIISHDKPIKDLNTTLIEETENIPKFKITQEDQKSLSEPFREYLLSRSVLTATPIDLSILNKSSDDDKITDSLIYCLDGNMPSDLTLSISNLAVDRSPLKSLNVNIDKSPNRKRCGSASIYESTSSDVKKTVNKENSDVFELRETEL